MPFSLLYPPPACPRKSPLFLIFRAAAREAGRGRHKSHRENKESGKKRREGGKRVGEHKRTKRQRKEGNVGQLREKSGKEAQVVRRKARKEWEGSLGWTGGGRLGRIIKKVAFGGHGIHT
jgi:hypothetical protein